MKGQQRQLEEQRCELTFSAFLESSRAFFFFCSVVLHFLSSAKECFCANSKDLLWV